MRNFIIAAATALTLGACSTASTTVSPVVAADIASVQATAVKICAYEPTAQYVAAVIAANNPGLMAIDAFLNAVAVAICGAVTPPAAPAAAALRRAERLGPVIVLPPGPVSGNFVR
jgi:hypothetical protein